MTRGKKKEQHVLSPSELKTLEDERREIQEPMSAIDGGDQYGSGNRGQGIDRAALQRQDKALRDAIDAGSPARMSGYKKDKLAQEAKEIEARITEGMPTRAEMENPQRHPGAVRKHMEWEKRNIHKVEQWKQMQRHLNPGDPTSSSVERLRRDK